MKIIICLLITILIIPGCSRSSKELNQFPESIDKLLIKTEQEKGLGLMYYLGAIHELNFEDSARYEVQAPSDLSNTKFANELIDYMILGYQRTIAAGDKDNKFYKKLILESKIDTSNLLSYKDNSICILEGVRGNDTIFITDQNNNKDFRDDTIRFWKEIDPYSNENLIKVDYLIYNGKEYVTGANWINIGLWGGTRHYFVSQYYTASFSIGNSKYVVEVSIPENRFNFNNPKIALVNDNGIVKDTIPESEIISIGEVVKLKEGYYRFLDLTNDGSYLTLIKEDDFDSMVGIQAGMNAPDFTVISINNDTINLKALLDKPVLIANISGCTPRSYDIYTDIIEKCAGRINIIGIESGISKVIEGVLIDVEMPVNKDIYNKYRKAYSDYKCYLIGLDGKIIDKFDIFNWQSALSPFLDSLSVSN
jgi:hypothetical protein